MRTEAHHRIAREGIPICGLSFILVLAAFWLHWAVALVALAWFLFCVYFFRNPHRVIPLDAGVFVCPADGKIVFVGKAEEPDFIRATLPRVTIFMSPFNVHVNRSPESGAVLGTVYHRGRFMAAFREDASLFNERSSVHLKTVSGAEVVFVQIAGWFARRIISYAEKGQKLTRGDVFGLIKFGSRMDVYLPEGAVIAVKPGDVVKAGETILARIKG